MSFSLIFGLAETAFLLLPRRSELFHVLDLRRDARVRGDDSDDKARSARMNAI